MFFACVLALHSLPLPWRVKKFNLLIASYLFYSAWNPPFVILLWVSTVVDWYAAQGLVKARRQAARHAWMLLSVIANLGMLGYFKYGQFLLDSFSALLSSFGVVYQPAHYDIVLPVGISFYTFATMSYTLDVYLRRAAPAQNLLDYALFVTFFPHLVAGPIMRPTELVPQFAEPRRASAQQLRFGLALMTIGLFNKVVLADRFLAKAAERVYDGSRLPGALDAWAATLAFSGQIFCDFAGYSTTAIGAALCLGFAMPDNFRFPYAAVGFSDFWRRWHITLSSWLRDYLYIPLGGNRHGPRRTYAALMTTMLLGGLWHGANWTFVAWGGLHGLYLSVERLLRARCAHYRPGPAGLRGARHPHLCAGERDLGVLPRQDLRQGVDRAARHGRPERWHTTDPLDLQSAVGGCDRRRHSRHPLADALAHPRIGGGTRSGTAGERGLGTDGICNRDRPGRWKCIHLLPVLRIAPDAYARQTAADRPGVAQPVPLRPVPVQPWGPILLGAVLAFAVLLGAWEALLARLRGDAQHPQQLWAVGDPAPAHRCRRGRCHGTARRLARCTSTCRYRCGSGSPAALRSSSRTKGLHR